MASNKINRIITLLKNNVWRNSNFGIMQSLHIAGIVRNGKIISMGTNHPRSTFQKKLTLSIHAEHDAIWGLLKYYKMHTLGSILSDTPNQFLSRELNQCLQGTS